jgi:Methyltransferase domain
MRRVQFFEIHDQPWFPAFLRDEVTDDLQVLLNIGKPYADILPQLREGIERARADRVLDLCSGAGGPWIWLADTLGGNGLRVQVELSDKYPNAQARERVRRDSAKLTYRQEPVDATRVPRELGGFRTLFTSFHHFPPEQAREILRDAVRNRQGIGVFEIPGRRPLTLLLLPLVLVGDIAVVPFVRPRPTGRLLWGLVWRWLVPIVPLVLLFDGIVSCLRAYSPGELRELASALGECGYRWEIGCVKRGFLRLPITFLVGYPI